MEPIWTFPGLDLDSEPVSGMHTKIERYRRQKFSMVSINLKQSLERGPRALLSILKTSA